MAVEELSLNNGETEPAQHYNYSRGGEKKIINSIKI
jgi:hypothetical protein